jgi:RNA polymerase sigma-70 factor (ECF subfamily)
VPPAPDGDPVLAAALVRLRDHDQEVLRLWAWEGLEPKEVAVVLGITANAAAVRLSRARAALRKELGKEPGKGLSREVGKDPDAAGQRTGRAEEVPGR